MKFKLTFSKSTLFWGVIILTMLVRLLSLGVYPLADTTEARYGEIALLMAKSGNWITPQIHDNIPFWGKPPLSTWLSAISIKIFGINEFAVRLPSLLLAFVILALVYTLAKKQCASNFPIVSTTVLATSVLFFVSSGTVMTDTALLLGTTISMVSFWLAMTENSNVARIWGYFFFVGLAIGLLAKGPAALVLTFIPVGTWIFWQKQKTNAWHKIPWLTGLMLCLMLSVPWYYMAERKTPGFLNYFLIGEHWKRFMVSGWRGDLYGHAHSHTLGTIWLYWLLAAMPWSLVLLIMLRKKKFRLQIGRVFNHNSWLIYLALWAITPMIVFTLARNILWTYILPGLPAFALLVTEFMLADQVSTPISLLQSNVVNNLYKVAKSTLLLFTLGLLPMAGHWVSVNKCQKELVLTYQKDRNRLTGGLIYFIKRPYSAEFYSHNTAQLAKESENLKKYFDNLTIDYFAVRKGDMEFIPKSFTPYLDYLGEFAGYYLLKEKHQMT